MKSDEQMESIFLALIPNNFPASQSDSLTVNLFYHDLKRAFKGRLGKLFSLI